MSGIYGLHTTYPGFVLAPPPTSPEMTDLGEPEQPGAEGLFSETPCTIHVLSSTSREVDSSSKLSIKDKEHPLKDPRDTEVNQG